MRLRHFFAAGIATIVAIVALSTPAGAQSSAFSADDISDLIQGGIPDETIAVRALAHCVTFRMTAGVTERFESLGATNSLVRNLGKVCYKGRAEPGDKPKVVPAVKPIARNDSSQRPTVNELVRKDSTPKLLAHYYRYLLSTRSGIGLPAGEISAVPATGRAYLVERDEAGRPVRRVAIWDGKPQTELKYFYTGSSRLADSTVTFLATGEVSSVNHLAFDAAGNLVSARSITPFGDVTEVLKYADIGADREVLDSLPGGETRSIAQYSPAGMITGVKSYLANGRDHVDYSFDPETGLLNAKTAIRGDSVSVITKYSRGPDGTLTREDYFFPHDVWIGATEFSDGLETVTRYKWPNGETLESRPTYDARKFETERTFVRNGNSICKFEYDRYANGRIKRTLAVAPTGELMAEYPNLYVTFVEKTGHPGDMPMAGKIYKTTPWW